MWIDICGEEMERPSNPFVYKKQYRDKPHLFNPSKHKNSWNAIIYTDTELKFG